MEPAQQTLQASDAAFPARVLCGLLGWAEDRSISHDILVHGMSDRDRPKCFSYDVIRLAFARANRMHGGGDLGCRTGARKGVHHLGPLGPAQLAQQTLGAAMRYGVRHQQLAGSVLRILLQVEGDAASIECHRRFDDAECGPVIDVDHMVTAWSVMTSFCRKPLPVQRVELASCDKQLLVPLSRMFNAPVSLGRPISRFVFEASLLDTPNPSFDDMTLQFWLAACDNERGELGIDSPLTLIRMMRNEANELRSLDELAQHMGVSTRTVHRLLAKEGIAYSAEVDRYNRMRAETLLSRGESMDDIAEMLGLSDARSFRRSFRRWTGMSPGQYRKSLGERGRAAMTASLVQN